jgi:hypothetical protein
MRGAIIVRGDDKAPNLVNATLAPSIPVEDKEDNSTEDEKGYI